MLLLFFFVGSMKASYLTVYQGTVENGSVPFGGVNFNYNTRSQYVIPAANLKNMVGGGIYCLMYYLTNFNAGEMPEEKVKVYMKEVNYTTISTFEPLSANDLVYEGTLTESETSGIRLLLVTLDKPFIYKGGNLLIDFENTETGTALGKKFYGKTVNGASITTWKIGQSVSQCNFIPQTTFLYNPKPTITSITSTPTTATVSWTGETKPFFVAERSMDCEGVTMDPATGDVYYIVERKQEVRRLRAPEYNESELLTVIKEVGYRTNSGLEAITWMGDGTLMLGNQAKPRLLIRYSPTEGILGQTEITEGIVDISDLCYDPVRKALWIPDSEARTINLCTLEGKVIASYPVPFIDNGESLYVDRDRQCIWVGDDTTSKLYKISFKNL